MTRDRFLSYKMVRIKDVIAFLLWICLPPAALAQVPFQLLVKTGGNSFLAANNATLNFATDALGKTVSSTIVLTYQGVTSASINQPQIFGPNSFTLTGFAASTLNPGDSLSLTVQFTPSDVTQATAQLNIPYTEKGAMSQSAATNGTIAFTLSGTVPSLVVTYALPMDGNVIAIDTGNTIGFPSAVVGTSITAAMGVVNRGSGTGLIQSISISGNSFSLQSLPLLPATVPPASAVQFGVRYAPSQMGNNSGTLQIVFSDRTVTLGLQGSAILSLLTYQLLQGTQTTPVTPGQSLTFPPTNVGDKSSLTILAKNTSSSSTTISGATVAGTVFAISDSPILPVTLNLNNTAAFTVTFAPTQAGTSSGKLQVGNDSFDLVGTGSPMPSYKFTGTSGNQAAGNQAAVGIVLDSGYSIEIDGKLTLSADNGSLPPDPGVQFASGGRVVAFTIPANTTQAIFSGGTNQISFQTGTVAGTITITPSFALPSGVDVTPMPLATLSISVPPGPPHLSNALVSQESPNTFTLQISGYAPTRNLSTLQFQFLAQPSANLANGAISLNIQANAQGWFSSTQSQNFGGEFLVTVPFSFVSSQTSTTSVVSVLQSVSITGSNDLGTSNSVVVALTQ